MTNSLGAQMLVAYDRNKARAERIRSLHNKLSVMTDCEQFELELRNRFLLGVHRAFAKEMIAWLRRNVGAQQRIADALGLKDRTSISKMLRSGTMDGIRITATLYQFGHIVTMPSRDRAALHGFAQATSYVKAKVYEDDSIEGSMTSQDFADLIALLTNDEWYAALRDPNPAVARVVAVKIISETEILNDQHRTTRTAYRPEQCVMMLRHLQEAWADYAVIALDSIPDCIPVEESNTDARL